MRIPNFLGPGRGGDGVGGEWLTQPHRGYPLSPGRRGGGHGRGVDDVREGHVRDGAVQRHVPDSLRGLVHPL